MSNSKKVLRSGARASKLSVVQSEYLLTRLKEIFPMFDFQLVPSSSPGDRDRALDLQTAPEDFFCRDLDEALQEGTLDMAVHSAKDLPDEMAPPIDFFYLPWRESRNDVLILPHGMAQMKEGALFGVSSARREEYCRKYYPHCRVAGIRGNIDDRIAQLDSGKFDAIILAEAGLKRLHLEERISRRIPLEELDTPEEQGTLAVTFRRGNRIMQTLRRAFVHPVVFAGASVGRGNVTQAVIEALGDCDVCIHDALIPDDFSSLIPHDVKRIYVGKRAGQHSLGQKEISSLIAKHCRRGAKVVRLKGGDPSIFGRLEEEIDLLHDLDLPYRILPGISAFQCGASSCDIPLTQRAVQRGFLLYTPRSEKCGEILCPDAGERNGFLQIIYMGARAFHEVRRQLMSGGCEAETPVVAVYDAGGENETAISGSLKDIKLPDDDAPGLIFIGRNARRRRNDDRRKVLFAGSEELAARARIILQANDFAFLSRPQVRLEYAPGCEDIFARFGAIDVLIIPSPGAARLFFELAKKMKFDLRHLPCSIAVSGEQTARKCREYGIAPDIVPDPPFGSEALAAAMMKAVDKGKRILRIASDAAPESLSAQLKAANYKVDDHIFYRTVPLKYDGLPGDFDGVLLTSPSAVRALYDNCGGREMTDKVLAVIGKPTYIEACKLFPENRIVSGAEATLDAMVEGLKYHFINEDVKNFI